MNEEGNNYDKENSDDINYSLPIKINIQVPRLKKLMPNLAKVASSLCSSTSSVVGLIESLSKTGEARLDLARERINRRREIETVLSSRRNETDRKVTLGHMKHQYRVDDIVSLGLQRLVDVETWRIKEEPSVEYGREIDDDWLNTIYTQGGNRSSSVIKEAFARILAGEIQRPGTFSLATLHTVGSLDERVAKLVVKASTHSIAFSYPAGNSEYEEVMIPALDGHLGENSLEKEGLGYVELLLLVEHNIIHSELNSTASYTCTVDGKRKDLTLNGALFTSVGRELITVVDDEEISDEFVNRLKKHFHDQVGESIKFNRKSSG